MTAPSDGAGRRAVVLAGGDGPEATATVDALAAVVAAADVIVAADSGLVLAERLGWRVDVAVGDFDSTPPDVLARAAAAGTAVERHPIAKDATDLDLALVRAAALGATRATVIGGGGGRLDHLVANAVLLCADDHAALELDAWIGDARAWVVRRETRLDLATGRLVSLLAMGGTARGVRTTGLAFPLDGEVLVPGSSRGVSNVVVAPGPVVALASGVLLAIAPAPEAGAHTRPGGATPGSGAP